MSPGPKGCDCGECVTCLWRECEETAADALRLTRELATARNTIARLEAALTIATDGLGRLAKLACPICRRDADAKYALAHAGAALAASTPPAGTPPVKEMP